MGKQSEKIRDLILNALPESLTLNGINSMYVRRIYEVMTSAKILLPT